MPGRRPGKRDVEHAASWEGTLHWHPQGKQAGLESSNGRIWTVEETAKIKTSIIGGFVSPFFFLHPVPSTRTHPKLCTKSTFMFQYLNRKIQEPLIKFGKCCVFT